MYVYYINYIRVKKKVMFLETKKKKEKKKYETK